MVLHLKFLLAITLLLEINNSRAQLSSSCGKKHEVNFLLDTANDFIRRAKHTDPTCSFLSPYSHYTVHSSESVKTAALLGSAESLISAAKNAYSSGDGLPEYKVVCYFASWSVYRKGRGKFEPSNIDANLCTHIIYAFAKLSYNQIEARDSYSDLEGSGNLEGFKHFNDLKLKNPKLKTLLSIGGWNTGSEPFSSMASDAGNRTRFVESVAPFLQKYGFDGLDLDWEYPGSNGGKPEDKQNFVILLQELKTNLKAQGLLLTATVPSRKLELERGYNIRALSKELDFINLMTFNFHGYGYQENETGMHTPLFKDEESGNSEMTIDSAVDYWSKGGASKDKLLMGLSLEGNSYTLRNEEQHGIGAPTVGPGHEGPYTRQAGTLGFNEICVNLTRNSWNSVYDSNARAPYAYKGDQWVSYDDMNSFNSKIDYVIEKGLAGVALWTIDLDDFRGYCYGKKYYLLNTVASRLLPRNN